MITNDLGRNAHLSLPTSPSPQTIQISLLSKMSTTTCWTTYIPTYLHRTTKTLPEAPPTRHQLALMKSHNHSQTSICPWGPYNHNRNINPPHNHPHTCISNPNKQTTHYKNCTCSHHHHKRPCNINGQ